MPYRTARKNDYVSGWFFKASRFMQGTPIRAAFVATNSIIQGEQVPSIWKPLFERFDIHFDFAWPSFVWDNQADQKAHVHVVIVGFSQATPTQAPLLFSDSGAKEAENISPYLIDLPTIFLESRTKSICNVPPMVKGSQPTDNGNFILTKEEKDSLQQKYPELAPYIKQLTGAKEYINDDYRYCLWLEGCSPKIIRGIPEVTKRILNIKEFRLKSTKKATRKCAETPTLFQERRQPKSTYIIVPSSSSERRRYIPMGFLNADVIATNLVMIIPDAGLYHFGVLTSNVHMAWMRTVTGRLKSDYRYSKDIVYNNFPWPEADDEQRAAVEKTAQAILDARALYPDSSLADLYDEVLMPVELRRAHQANDRAVMKLYGFSIAISESECVKQLMIRYSEITNQESGK
ncbi:MAG: hypothetical protein NC301_09660 [Bacteroides sp.]|nr:hypothetical protein [Bacteroides sp.]